MFLVTKDSYYSVLVTFKTRDAAEEFALNSSKWQRTSRFRVFDCTDSDSGELVSTWMNEQKLDPPRVMKDPQIMAATVGDVQMFRRKNAPMK